MTDRERIAELAKIKQIAQRKIELGVSFGMTPEQVTNEVFDFLEAIGYTHQPEPSPDRVKAVAKLLYFKAGGDGWEKEPDKPKHYLDLGKETFRKTAREILKLSPVPVLTLLSEDEKIICAAVSKYSYSEIKDVIDEVCKHQLVHDQDTLNKEAGK